MYASCTCDHQYRGRKCVWHTHHMLSSGNCLFNLTSCSLALRPLPFFSRPNCSNTARSSLSGGSNMHGRVSATWGDRSISSHTFLNPMLVFASWIRHLKGYLCEGEEEWSIKMARWHDRSSRQIQIYTNSGPKSKLYNSQVESQNSSLRYPPFVLLSSFTKNGPYRLLLSIKGASHATEWFGVIGVVEHKNYISCWFVI